MGENAIQRLLRLAQREQQTIEVREKIIECLQEIGTDPELKKSFKDGSALTPGQLQSITQTEFKRLMGDDAAPLSEEQITRMLNNVSRAILESKNDNN
jgi:hypothetical protein